MSVPLDRLYNFLEGLCNQLSCQDTVIYRFYPHGSKNLENCILLDQHHSLKIKTFNDYLTSRVMICHDQEPLDFDSFYTKFEFPTPDNVAYDPFRGKIHVYAYLNVFDKSMLCHSETNSEELKKFEDNGCIGVYYWSHALIARDWFRYAQHESKFNLPKSPANKFLVYNRAWSGTREYRLLFTEMIVKNNLTNLCKMKFSPVCDGVDYRSHKFKNSNLAVTHPTLDHYFPENHTGANASADFVVDDYLDTEVEVVLETIFDDTRHHLTEKTLRPIACGQPFLLISTPGSLGYLKGYGFETFGDIIDESYDLEIDPVKRLEKIVNVMKSIAALSDSEIHQLRCIAQRNRAWFFSNDFQQQIINEFKQNFSSALLEMNKHCRASFLLHQEQFNPDMEEPNLVTLFSGHDEYQELLSWVDRQRRLNN